MSPREAISDHGLLFGENSLYEVLLAVASRRRSTFHGAQLAREIGRTDAQVQAELAKLTRLGVLKEVPHRGRARPYATTRTVIARTVLALPPLLEDMLGAYERPVPPPGA